MILGQDALGVVGGDHRDREILGQGGDDVTGTVVEDVDTGNDQRPFGGRQPLAGGFQIGAGWGTRGRRHPARHRRSALHRLGDRNRDVDMDRPRLAVEGHGEGLVDDHAGGPVVEGESGPGDRLQHRPVIEDLMGVGHGVGRIDAAGQEDQGNPVLFGIGDDVDRVADPGADGGEQDARRPAGEVGPLGHEAGRVLVLGENELDADGRQGVHQGQHLAARDAESEAAAGVIEAAGDDLRRRRRRRLPRRVGASLRHVSSPPGLASPRPGACSRPGSGEFSDPGCATRRRCAGSAPCRHRW